VHRRAQLLPADAAGFINLFGLPLKINALMKEKAGK